MKVRKLTTEGDYTLGHGSSDFYQNTPDGVAQNVMTRLALWQGQWFLDTESGTPWLQQILGKKDAVEAVIRSRILETPGVNEITDFSSVVDPDTRSLSISATLDTEYGTATINEAIQ